MIALPTALRINATLLGELACPWRAWGADCPTDCPLRAHLVDGGSCGYHRMTSTTKLVQLADEAASNAKAYMQARAAQDKQWTWRLINQERLRKVAIRHDCLDIDSALKARSWAKQFTIEFNQLQNKEDGNTMMTIEEMRTTWPEELSMAAVSKLLGYHKSYISGLLNGASASTKAHKKLSAFLQGYKPGSRPELEAKRKMEDSSKQKPRPAMRKEPVAEHKSAAAPAALELTPKPVTAVQGTFDFELDLTGLPENARNIRIKLSWGNA